MRAIHMDLDKRLICTNTECMFHEEAICDKCRRLNMGCVPDCTEYDFKYFQKRESFII